MKPHRFDPLSFVTGVFALAIGLLYLIPGEPTAIIDFIVDAGSWFWPVLFLAVGAAVLIPLFVKNKEQDELSEAQVD